MRELEEGIVITSIDSESISLQVPVSTYDENLPDSAPNFARMSFTEEELLFLKMKVEDFNDTGWYKLMRFDPRSVWVEIDEDNNDESIRYMGDALLCLRNKGTIHSKLTLNTHLF